MLDTNICSYIMRQHSPVRPENSSEQGCQGSHPLLKAASGDAVSSEFGNRFHHVPQAQSLDSFPDRETFLATVHDKPAGGF